jgi:hypothetical protein
MTVSAAVSIRLAWTGMAGLAAPQQLSASMRLRMKGWSYMATVLFLLDRSLRSGDEQSLRDWEIETQIVKTVSENYQTYFSNSRSTTYKIPQRLIFQVLTFAKIRARWELLQPLFQGIFNLVQRLP